LPVWWCFFSCRQGCAWKLIKGNSNDEETTIASERNDRKQSQGFPNLGLWATFIFEMTVTIPSERLANITLNERDALVDIAIGLYKREQVSLGRAAEVSGLSSPEFLNELGRRRIPINYEAEDLRLDLDTFKRLS